MPAYLSIGCGFYCLLEVLEFDMHVEFGGVEVAMAEQLLHVTIARLPRGVAYYHGAATDSLLEIVAELRLGLKLSFALTG